MGGKGRRKGSMKSPPPPDSFSSFCSKVFGNWGPSLFPAVSSKRQILYVYKNRPPSPPSRWAPCWASGRGWGGRGRVDGGGGGWVDVLARINLCSRGFSPRHSLSLPECIFNRPQLLKQTNWKKSRWKPKQFVVLFLFHAAPHSWLESRWPL